MNRTIADYPKLVAQWHPTKNGILTPADVSYASDKRCWWKCPVGDDHEWETNAWCRTSGDRVCPFCCNQRVCKSNCLNTTHPLLAAEWHPIKNGFLTPLQVVSGSSKKVWWRCSVADDHEWEAVINHRAIVGSGCPCCNGKKVVRSNCLAVMRPDIAVQWHPTKNGAVSAFDVLAGGGKKIWWTCGRGHEWRAEIGSRIRADSGCPYCINKKACEDNCLATIRPDLAAQWHPTKNGNLTPCDVVAGSAKKVWWKCDKSDDHEWQVSPVSRAANDSGCPCCSGRKAVLSNSIATTHPELASQWHPKNVVMPSEVTAGSGQIIWWCCEKGHEWDAPASTRSGQGQGCPYCARKRACVSNSLKTTHPELAAQWHPTKNGECTAEHILFGTDRKVWWKCPVADDHEWEVSVLLRANKGYGCPFCSNNRVCLSNSLATVFPELAAEWHPIKNGTLLPSNVVAGGQTKVWWKCPVGDDHEWETAICNRVNGTGCPVCVNRIVVPSNCLATTHPDLAVQWHPTKNGFLTPQDVTICKKKVWWKCPVADDHVWKACVFSRMRDGRGCPCCANLKVVPSNCLATTHPELAAQWHENNALSPHEVTAGSTDMVLWKCPVADDHVWETRVFNRGSNRETGCPCCLNKKIVASNCLSTTHPELAAQWHPIRNGTLTSKDVVAGGAAKVWWVCSEGHEWKASLHSRAKGCGCPICCESKGEQKIASVLAKYGLSYERQVKFAECRHANVLSFDFGVRYNGLLHLIEFQGEQHYRPVNFGSKQDDVLAKFDLIKKRDSIKRRYCKKNMLPFLEIPYWERDGVEMLVVNFLGLEMVTSK